MTLPVERTRAVRAAEIFLIGLASGEIKHITKDVRDMANRILRHFPTKFDLSQSAQTLPERWGPPE